MTSRETRFVVIALILVVLLGACRKGSAPKPPPGKGLGDEWIVGSVAEPVLVEGENGNRTRVVHAD